MGIVDWWMNHPAGELAGWWEKNHNESEKALNEFVDAHPNWWVVAAITATAMDVGAGTVDLLRFGEGAAEFHETGKIAPLIQDVFRGASIATSAAAGIKTARPLVGRLVGLYADGGGDICAAISVGNAIRRTGQRFLLSLDEIARAHGLQGISFVQGLSITESIAALRKLAIAFEEIPAAGSMESLGNIAKRGNGVVMFRVVDEITGEGHRILLERAGAGVRIVDRSGFCRSLQELSVRYGRSFVIDSDATAVFIKNAMSKLVNGLPTLMTYANSLTVKLAANRTVPEVDAKFREFKKQASAAANASTSMVLVSPGDTLSGLAQKQYGSMKLWPLLWDANRNVVGSNPNLIRPGMMLKVPPLSRFTSAEIQDAERRFASWRNY